MADDLFLAGVSHRSATLRLRERVALDPVEARELLRDLVALGDVREAMVLSTCARTEFYAFASDPDVGVLLPAVLARRARRWPRHLRGQIRTDRGRGVVEHLLRLTAGLESLVLGEVEILGQVRRAAELARAAGATAQVLGGLVDRSIGFGRDIRAKTEIGAGRSSVSSVAVDLALRLLPPDAGGRAVVVGSGEVGGRAAKALRAQGLQLTIVAGRRPEPAHRLAADLGGR